MLGLVLLFLVLSISAAIVGFGGFASVGVATTSKVLFVAFLICQIIATVIGQKRDPRW